ncbi:Cysteinyl leukotriene receptor 2, variant 2 [Entomophthora muscae]|uniref:Cysteinyl leukotriene receptor 2, variant 2 n=1 Tax=Entomophthora muscae TaxID=34485 RepID=A0ACC2SSH2_9FUNG|nr:Cysteinyl leukotriene receptor 2, variant 2 [Entomophthora muscae]
MVANSQTHVEAVDLIYLLLGVFSLVLNGIMVYVTLRQKRGSWAIDITLLLLIGVSDILAGLVAVVLQFWKLNSSYTAAYSGSHWCYANAVLSHSTLLTTITLTALLALVRYLTIVRGKSVSNRICTVAAMFLISLCWASSVAKGVLSDSVLDPSGFVCSLSDKTNWHISAAIYIACPPDAQEVQRCCSQRLPDALQWYGFGGDTLHPGHLSRVYFACHNFCFPGGSLSLAH